MGKGSLGSLVRTSYVLAKADIRVKNEGSYFGALWNFLDPLFIFLILLFIRGVFNIGLSEDYPLYLLIGLIVFNFFRQSSVRSLRSISGNSQLINNLKISPWVLALSSLFHVLFSHIFELLLLVIMMIFYGNSIISLVFYPLIFILIVSFVFGISLLLSTIVVFFRDIENIWKMFVRLLWFATPVFYGVVPGSLLYRFNQYNPLFYYISLVRDVIIYQIFPETRIIIITIFFSLFFLFLGIYIFNKFEGFFAENL